MADCICETCIYYPPSSLDGKPCCMCDPDEPMMNCYQKKEEEQDNNGGYPHAVEGLCCDCIHAGPCCSWDENENCPQWKDDGTCWEPFKAEYISKEQLLAHLFSKQDEPMDVMKEIAEFRFFIRPPCTHRRKTNECPHRPPTLKNKIFRK